ncbi:unnamed protein product, partial [Closterium sp. NIES-54]
MEVARTSMIDAAAPHFLWPFAVWYAAHQLNLCPRVSLPETSPTQRWTGKVGDASVFRFYHPTPCRVFPSQDITFDEPVPFYRLFPYCCAPHPPLSLFLVPSPPPVDPLPPQGPAPSGAARGAASGGAEPGGAESEGAGSGGAEPGGAEPGGAERAGVEPGGADPEGVETGGADPKGVEPGGAESKGARSKGAEPRGTASPGHPADTGAGGAGVTAGAGGTGGAIATGPGGARTRGAGAGGTGAGGARAGGAGAGDTGAVGTGAGGPGAGGTGAGGAGAGDTGAVDPRAGGAGAGGASLAPASPLPAPSPYTEQTGGLTERHELESRRASLVRSVRTGRRVPHPRPPCVPGTHAVGLRPSSVPLRVPVPPPPTSSLPAVPDPESILARTASPTISRLLATVVTDPCIESTAASALVADLVDFAAACRLDYATALHSTSASPPSVG